MSVSYNDHGALAPRMTSTAPSIIDRATDKLGVRAVLRLGVGMYGEVWRTTDGVLKVSRDPFELDLLRYGARYGLRGLPTMMHGPQDVGDGYYAYEREALGDLGIIDTIFPSHALEQVARLDIFKEVSLQSYDRVVWHDPEVERGLPLIAETLRHARERGHLIFDLAPRNLGVRLSTGETVIRDGRLSRWPRPTTVGLGNDCGQRDDAPHGRL